MKKSFFSLLVLAVVAIFAVACNQSGASSGEKTGDAAATQNTTTPGGETAATPPATPAEDAVDPNLPKTTIEFEGGMEHDWGNIKEGEVVNHTFKFKNTGKEPLIISSAKGSCGCTVPSFPKEPIAPGATSEIKVEFNSKGKKNQQTKTVTINANTDPNPTRLTIKSNVIPDPNAPAAAAAPAGGAPQIQVQPGGKAPAGK
ncbi:MAG: DUF1573 domain-containing protein [Sphingobacteriales bacterium]|jgi:hypothetical protein|nr:DUF1573 domain-containing protein [Sphingobacteriales bacterium]MBP9141278.1 DUF1573 domain-containing protein [Chitinophagales bacterium]MDA0197942.1 DUF1573 domain-containing protein [Bacteroidota bacterium]MBK6890828.1 DUF1573 domain-containing protein [Sphingobacteriales bacterium]MBK7526119.1 DUF1573 domain-containing protein [Sphingobacteriales bacterium]